MNTHTQKVAKYFNTPESYLKNRFDILARKQIIEELLGFVTGSSILDMGCGNGALSMDYLSSNKVHFVDIAENMLEIVRAQVADRYAAKNWIFTQASLDDFQSEQTFDIVLAIGLLAHVEDLDKSMEKLSSLVRPGGQLLIQFTDYDAWSSKAYFGFRSLVSTYHQTNKIGLSKLELLWREHKLIKKKIKAYSFMFPGMGFLPYALKKWIQEKSIGSSWAMDKIILLQKSEEA